MEAEKAVSTCFECQIVGFKTPSDFMKRCEYPERLWQKMVLDFKRHLPIGEHLFVIIDYYSKFIAVKVML